MTGAGLASSPITLVFSTLTLVEVFCLNPPLLTVFGGVDPPMHVKSIPRAPAFHWMFVESIHWCVRFHPLAAVDARPLELSTDSYCNRSKFVYLCRLGLLLHGSQASDWIVLTDCAISDCCRAALGALN